MHNVNVSAVKQTAAKAKTDPSAVIQHVTFDGEWQTAPGAPQCQATIPVPNGEPVLFQADFPAPMGGSGLAPNPLAYCFWGGLACYAMTYAQEAALQGIQLRSLRARVNADVDMSRALSASENPPVKTISWLLEVEANASGDTLEDLKRLADEHCPGAYCISNPIELRTTVRATAARTE